MEFSFLEVEIASIRCGACHGVLPAGKQLPDTQENTQWLALFVTGERVFRCAV
jgi:hypothetical protein